MSRFHKSLQRHQPLKEQAYQALRTAILSGELVPGQRLVEAQLARQFQVSRTPIREALGQLQREALVSADPDQGLRVATFTDIDAAQLYDCRLALEQLSVVAACDTVKPTQLRKLHQILQRSEKLVDSKPSTLLRFQLLDLDYQFHRLIAEMSDNLWLQIMLDQLFDKMMLLRIQTIQQNQAVLEIRTEHSRIYEAIAQRDPNTALTTLQDHLTAAKARVVHELQLLQSQSEVK